MSGDKLVDISDPTLELKSLLQFNSSEDDILSNIYAVPFSKEGMGDAPELITEETPPTEISELTSDPDLIYNNNTNDRGIEGETTVIETEADPTQSLQSVQNSPSWHIPACEAEDKEEAPTNIKLAEGNSLVTPSFLPSCNNTYENAHSESTGTTANELKSVPTHENQEEITDSPNTSPKLLNPQLETINTSYTWKIDESSRGNEESYTVIKHLQPAVDAPEKEDGKVDASSPTNTNSPSQPAAAAAASHFSRNAQKLVKIGGATSTYFPDKHNHVDVDDASVAEQEVAFEKNESASSSPSSLLKYALTTGKDKPQKTAPQRSPKSPRLVEVHERKTPVTLKSQNGKPVSPYLCKIFPIVETEKGKRKQESGKAKEKSNKFLVSREQNQLLHDNIAGFLSWQEKFSLLRTLVERSREMSEAAEKESSVSTIFPPEPKETYMSWLLRGGGEFDPRKNKLRHTTSTQVSKQERFLDKREMTSENEEDESDDEDNPLMVIPQSQEDRINIVSRGEDFRSLVSNMYKNFKVIQAAIQISDYCFFRHEPELLLKEVLSEPSFNNLIESSNEIEILQNLVTLLSTCKGNVEGYLNSIQQADLTVKEDSCLTKISSGETVKTKDVKILWNKSVNDNNVNTINAPAGEIENMITSQKPSHVVLPCPSPNSPTTTNEGVDKPPGPTLSPPPYSRTSYSTNARTSGGSRASNIRLPATGASSRGIPEDDMMMIRGSGAMSTLLDPRTKKPVIPQAGRSVPKLKMAHLTSSLAPLVESQIIPDMEQVGPLYSGRGKRTTKGAAAASAKGSLKGISSNDLLESFDSALRMPDVRTINSKVIYMRKISSLGGGSGRGNSVQIIPSKSSSQKLKSSGKVEEQNMKRLMGQLRDKYLDDMESQLGLAVERRPKLSLAESLIQDQSEDEEIKVRIPQPSTNAAEISSRIDKVVREWATESQKLSKQERNATTKQQGSGGTPINNSSPHPESPRTSKNPGKRNKGNSGGPPGSLPAGKNKHLAKISTAFRKSLDPITKRDVRELISVPENDVENLQVEHDVRVKAHEAVFKNAVVGAHFFPDDEEDTYTGKNKVVPGNKKPSNPKRVSETKSGSEEPKENNTNNRNNKAQPINSKLKPFAEAIGLASKSDDGETEVYNIIKDHMNSEMASGPPKLSAPSTRRVNSTTGTTKASSTTLLRSDVAGKALQKYGESQKKLQGLVNTFTQKVESFTKPTVGVGATKRAEVEPDSSKEEARTPQLSSLASQSTLNARRDNAAAANSAISRSMRTIGRASNVAQRLGTLMSRVALRNETYEYEKEQEAKQKSISSLPDDDLPPSAIASNPIKRFSTSSTTPTTDSLMMKQSGSSGRQINPYENSDFDLDLERPNIPTGVSKLDSSQFDKYVEEMKKVAERAAESFEKFKDRNDDTECVSFSEDEEDSDADYSYGSEKAYEAAAAAAEIAAQQEQKYNNNSGRKQKPRVQANVKIAQTSTRKTDSQTSPRDRATINRIVNRSSGSYLRDDENNNNLGNFKFVPDMSYTDQMMLQKLRKLKEQEGWGDSSQGIDMGDVPSKEDLETLVTRVGKGIPKETERVGMGPSSLNSVIRSRMKGRNVAKK